MYDAVEAAQPDISTLSENQFRDCEGMTSCLPQLSLTQSRPGVSSQYEHGVATVCTSGHRTVCRTVLMYYINTRHLNIAQQLTFSHTMETSAVTL